MIKGKALLLLFTNPVRFFKKVWRYIDFLIIDPIFFFLALIIFHFFPKYLYLLYNGKYIVNSKQRWAFNQNIENDFILNKKPKKMFDEINIIGKGDSIHDYLTKINLELPTFQVNVYEKLPLNTNYIGLTFSWLQAKKQAIAHKLFEKGLYPTIVCRHGEVSYNKKENISWTEKGGIYTKPGTKIDSETMNMINELSDYGVTHIRAYSGFNFTIGAILTTAMLLGPLSNKVNIYGCDHYLKKDVDTYSYYEALFYALGALPRKLYGTSLKKFLAESLINWYYISQLVELPKYKIFGRMSSIKRQKKILEKINKVFLLEG